LLRELRSLAMTEWSSLLGNTVRPGEGRTFEVATPSGDWARRDTLRHPEEERSDDEGPRGA